MTPSPNKGSQLLINAQTGHVGTVPPPNYSNLSHHPPCRAAKRLMRRIISRTTALSPSIIRSDSSASFKQRMSTTSSLERSGIDGIIASSDLRSSIQPRIGRQSRLGKRKGNLKPLADHTVLINAQTGEVKCQHGICQVTRLVRSAHHSSANYWR